MTEKIEVDDIIVDEPEKQKKKRKNSKAKGSRNELEIVKILSEHFGQKFARVGVSSGARTKNSSLPKDSVEFYCGDIITPKNFRYSIECKSGYSDTSILRINKTIDSFIEQVENDCKISNKEPMIVFKQDRQSWLCFLQEEHNKCKTYVKYRNYYIYDLKEILDKKTDWFEKGGVK